MSAGMLRSWYISKIAKSTTLMEYFSNTSKYAMYELSVTMFNTGKIFHIR